MAVPAQAINPSTGGHIQGNVDLAAGVSVASGVLLGAAPGCRLVISPGVCLGTGVVVQARHGDLVLEPGVSLGSGVLIVGHGSVGQHTCIGSNSTVINPALGASQVVAPGSLVGDPSQSPSQSPSQLDSPAQMPNSANGGFGIGAAFSAKHYAQVASGNAIYGSQNASSQAENAQNGFSNKNTSNSNTSNGSNLNSSSVYGKAQVNRLLTTLFPHRQALNGASPEDKS
ncbi:MAG: hypothetical protein WBG32_19785 [Nodosilinea sp.]